MERDGTNPGPHSHLFTSAYGYGQERRGDNPPPGKSRPPSIERGVPCPSSGPRIWPCPPSPSVAPFSTQAKSGGRGGGYSIREEEIAEMAGEGVVRMALPRGGCPPSSQPPPPIVLAVTHFRLASSASSSLVPCPSFQSSTQEKYCPIRHMNDDFGMDVARGRAGDEEEENKLILPLAISTSSFDGQSFQAESIFFRQASPALASLLPRHFQPPPFQCLPLPLGPPPSMLNGQIGPGEEQQFQQEGGQQPVFALQPFFGHPFQQPNVPDSTCPPDFASLQPNGSTTNGPELATLDAPIPPAICRGCGLLIQESHLLSLNRRRQKSEAENGESSQEASKGDPEGEEEADFWHEHCLRCAKCGRQLGEAAGTCFLHDGRPFCREDHEKLFGGSGTLAQCSRCALPIGPSEFVFRSAGLHVHHVQCFLCSCCGQALAKGDQYLCVGSKLPPFPPANGTIEQSPHFLPLPPFADLDFSLQRPTFHHHHHHGDRSKKVPKRPRTILNAPQRKAFKLAFERGAKPSRKVREQLARDTGLSVRVVQVWFQNQRAKMKKERKREMDKQQQQMGGLLPMSTGEAGTDSEECAGQLKSPNSGGSSGRNRSGMVVEDDSDEEGDEEEADDDEEEEEQDSATSCNSSGLLLIPAAGNVGTGMDGMEGGEEGLNAGPNPIERLYSMHQNYFAFV